VNDNDDTQALAQKKKKRMRKGPHYTTATGARRLAPSDRNARGAYGKYNDKICPDATAKYIKELQDHLKTLPGGDAMAKKVAGWGVFIRRRAMCYVDPDGGPRYRDRGAAQGKCYRGKPKAIAALTAEASA